MGDKQVLLRGLPKVDEVLQDERLVLFYETMPRPLIVDTVREAVGDVRNGILEGTVDRGLSQDEIMDRITAILAEKKKKKQDFFGNLFGSHAGNKKESKPEKAPKAPSEEEGVQDYDLLEAVQPKPKQVRPSRDHAEKKPTVKETAKKKAPTRRRGPRKKTSEMTEEEKAAARRAARKKKKKQGMNPVLLIVSLIIVVAAVFIVVRTVVPAFQTGIFSSQQAAEGLTLDRETLDLAEAGTTMTLVPTFSPEGSTGTVTWSSSDEAVATVDGQGMVTAVAPGTATITATFS